MKASHLSLAILGAVKVALDQTQRAYIVPRKTAGPERLRTQRHHVAREPSVRRKKLEISIIPDRSK